MQGILSIAAREDCRPCGGKALYVVNKTPSTPEELREKYGKRSERREKKHGRRL